MYEKDVERVTKMFDKQACSLRQMRATFLIVLSFAHIFLSLIILSAALNGHTGWGFILCLGWAWLIVQNVRLLKLKI